MLLYGRFETLSRFMKRVFHVFINAFSEKVRLQHQLFCCFSYSTALIGLFGALRYL